jgi:sugar/nucleoside kinase (ribokinase family)
VASFDVSVIGELNLDLILYGLPQELKLEHEHLAKDLSITLGSSSAIFAYNLSSLGNKVGFSSCIGSDPFGEICIQRLGASGVDMSRVRTYPGTMYDLSEKDLEMRYVFDAKHLHLSSYFLQKAIRPRLIDIFRKAKEAGLTTSLDTNDDPEDRWPADVQLLLKYVDILLPNEREACKLAQVDDVARAADILSQKVPMLVIKRGAQGALARVGKEKYSAYPPVVDATDVVGAGDSFDAGFVHKFIRGAKIEECLKFANIAGALSVTRAGGTEAFRDAKHRQEFLQKHAAGLSSSPVGAAPRLRK